MPTQTTQSTAVRGLPDNPSTSRRLEGAPPAATTNTNPPPPPLPEIPNTRNGTQAGLTASPSMTSAQVISLTREAMRNALEGEKSQAVDAAAAGAAGLKPGITIDLSRKSIQKLPEEAVDIVKTELERLALSHNQLSSLPARFAECTSLRYLNIRANQIKEFPMALCDIKTLEILDLGRNQLRSLPKEIINLSSLKVLSVPRNHIRELPLCIADMVSLQVLKFEGNPVSFPPKDAFQPHLGSPTNNGASRDAEVSEVATTAAVKKFLKNYAVNGRMESETTTDESSEGVETPKVPLKRAVSGRFPVKVSGSDVPDLRSPNGVQRPPVVPARSHQRGLSQHSTAVRRPGVMPLTIGNVTERLRSNSESLLRSDRPESRSRRMGMVPRKTSDLGTLDETDADAPFNHYRGLSHGSAMQETAQRSESPAASAEQYLNRPIYVRRLSILPERRRESKMFDPVIEAAKGILYSVFQIHPMIQVLMTLTNNGKVKRSSLEIVFYNTSSHVEELELEIQRYDAAMSDDDNPSPSNENVHRACRTLVSAYGHVCTLLADNVDSFVDNGDPRYIRTLLMLLYNSIMEIRVTLSSVTSTTSKSTISEETERNDTIKPYFREASAPAATGRPAMPPTPARRRAATHHTNKSSTTSLAAPPVNHGPRQLQTATYPRPAEPLTSLHTDAGAVSEEELQFERIFTYLKRSADLVMQTLPRFTAQLSDALNNAMQQRAPVQLLHWKGLIATCHSIIEQTEVMRNRINSVNMRDPAMRFQAGLWNPCISFIASWEQLISKLTTLRNKVPLPPDARARLKPIHHSMKETTTAIYQSPWHQLVTNTSARAEVLSPMMPITPQSAALGPAMQATMSSTPQSASFASAFHGNVFDRADALLANPGISMSRSGSAAGMRGHMPSHSNSSISSMSSDDMTNTIRR